MKARLLLLAALVLPAAALAPRALAQSACENDVDCYCGQVCSWAHTPHICVTATTTTPGWCDAAGDCLYNGQTCDTGTNACTPAWSSTSVCNAASCNVDADCACGQVCSWLERGVSGHVCVSAKTDDPGWCDSAQDCLYENQTCSGTACSPPWSENSVCVQSTTTTATAAASSTSGAASTTTAAASSGTTSGAVTSGSSAAASSGASSGAAGSSSGEASGATSGNPATASSGAASGTSSGSSAAASSGASSGSAAATATASGSSGASSGSTPADAGSGGSSGGCSTAPGAFALLSAVLGLALLRRRR